MEKYFDVNEAGHSVRCKLYYAKDPRDLKDIVIATHGFGGSKENKGFTKFAEKLTAKYKGYGVVCFDWPCHGTDARKKLTIAECLTYIELVVQYARRELGAERVYNYATSLGGYVALYYLAERGNPFDKIALRCPALRLYRNMTNNISEEDKVKLAKGKEVMIGFERKMKIDQAFLDDLENHDVMQNEYFDFADELMIIHGTKDTTVPIEDSRAFAEANVIEFLPVENADHPFTNPQCMDLAIHAIITFFAPEEN